MSQGFNTKALWPGVLSMRWVVVAAAILGGLPWGGAAAHAAVADSGMASARFRHGTGITVPREPWWEILDDGLLRPLVEQALSRNHDVAAATSRILQAEALAIQAFAPMLPALSFDVTSGASPSASLQFGAAPGVYQAGVPAAKQPEVTYNGSAMLKARYEIDVWGRRYLGYAATALGVLASRGDRDVLALTLAAQVGQSYFDAVAARERLGVVEEQLRTNRALLEVTEMRFARGEATGLDVLQQKQQVAGSKAQLPDARASYRVLRQRLALLTATPLGADLPEVAETQRDLPDMPGTGMPLDLMDNRPKLRAAGARLDAAQARAKSVFRNHLPRLSLSGQVGFQGLYRNDWDTDDTWGAGATLSFPLFSGGADYGATEEADASERSARQSLDQLQLQAVSEVDSALIQEHERHEQLAALEEQLDAARQAFEESKLRYGSGLAPYLSVLTALQALQRAELSVVQGRRAVIGSRLQLHQALGGPWTKGVQARTSGATSEEGA